MAFSSTYDDKTKDLYEKIANRTPFSYDSGDDSMYQMYKQRYMQSGAKAMRDTIGQGSALTGGYTNSYAQNQGQKAYQEYLDQLSGKMLENSQLALEGYQNEGNRLQTLFQNTSGLAQNQFDRWLGEQNLALQKEMLAWQKSQMGL